MKIKLLIVFVLLVSVLRAQNVTVSGYIADSESGERLIGANVFDANNTKYGTASNSYGFYSLTVPAGKYKLTATYFGYGGWQEELNITKDTLINIDISTDVKIEEVIIQAQHNQVESSQMGRIDVPMATIKVLPVIFGEVDVLKALQLLPGVQGGTEGTSGLYIRGGSSDQNLILLDGVPVYNANHLFGFFSVFNADAISNVTLYKGGFPARYGGRLSSVIDINLKEGNMKEFHGVVSVGIIASKFMVEGPIKKDKTSFMVAGRRTYIDVLAAPFIKTYSLFEEGMNMGAGYYFYDYNAKINHILSDKDRIFFSLYGGKDKAYANIKQEYESNKSESNMKLGWGNIISALRWNHMYNSKLFGNTTLTYSRFNFFTDISMADEWYDEDNTKHESEYGVAYDQGIDDISLKVDFDYALNNNNKIKFGAEGTYHIFTPGITNLFLKNDYFEIDSTMSYNRIYTREFALYFEDDIRIGNKLKVNLGTRFSAFHVRDTLFYSPEPRISARFIIMDGWSVKASFVMMKQYLHFLTSNTLGMPTDMWYPATDKIIPEKSYQYAVGTSIAVTDKVSLVIEGFYKEMTNLLELKEGKSAFGDFGFGEDKGDTWEDKVLQGNGWSYGAEFLLKKDVGKLTGWIGYTYAKADRLFAGDGNTTGAEQISNGEVFPFAYDRRHNLSIVANYNFNDNWGLSLTWVYGSGNPTTISQLQYIPINQVNPEYGSYYGRINYYGSRNNYRLPSVHRLDAGLNWTKEVRIGTRTWSLGVYNAYNHINPFFYQLESNYETGDKYLRVYSIFPIMPSLSYKIEF
ncbi:MAG: TonB-dependent receptor [Bacteroidales bacterium]|nr:TonB-dependent receptor [Bacteroidales bacterium]